MLKDRTVLKGSLQSDYTVGKYLAEGGQGSVHLVRDESDREFAVKWYFVEQATHEQRASLEKLVRQGAPAAPAGSEFVWPLDVVSSAAAPGFGYIMPLIDTRRFGDLNDVFAQRIKEPTLATLCRITLLASGSYRALHASGQCYRDISHGNILFDPVAGDVRVCDNDNVGPYGTTAPAVIGTWEYMAPEVAAGHADPSSTTDLHSLAVFLFKLWMWHHPLHGLREGAIRSLDDSAYRMLYGHNPVFIFDLSDHSNAAPDTPDYASVRRRWALCPAPLRNMFARAFTAGLRQPGKRVTEGEWQRAARAAADLISPCLKCRAQNSIEYAKKGQCWHCRSSLPSLPWLRLRTRLGENLIPLQPSLRLVASHLSGSATEDSSAVTKMSQHPSDPQIWGLTNLTEVVWRAKFADGSSRDIPPQRSVPLNRDTEIMFCPTDPFGASARIETS